MTAATTTPHLVESGFTEIVRGNEWLVLERIMPQVKRRSVSLDLHKVKRIDAAGITALVLLYRAACEAGHRFTVSHATRHVREILVLVGLDRILGSQNTDRFPKMGICFTNPTTTG